MKRFFAIALSLLALSASAVTLNPVQLLNPAGSVAGQAVVSTGPTTAPAWGSISLSGFPPINANSVVANATASSAPPSALAVPSCSASGNALQWTSGTGFSCGTVFALTTGTLGQFASTTSAQLAAVLSDETGTGSNVFGTSPTISSPSLTGTPTAPTAATGTNTTQVATTAFVANSTINNAQTLTDVTASRALSTTYTNSTGRPIWVSVRGQTSAANGSLSATVSGFAAVAVGQKAASGDSCNVNFIVPNGLTYSVVGSSATLVTWVEFR